MPPKKAKSKKARAQKISEKELKSLKKEFDSIDMDHNGELDKDELMTFMSRNKFQQEFANIAIKLFDKDGNGQISFEEFVDFTKALSKLEEDPILLQKMLFATLDKDGNGYLDSDEINSFFEFFSHDCISDEDIYNIINNLDENGDGQLSFEELMRAFT